jgi:hypothetical protein
LIVLALAIAAPQAHAFSPFPGAAEDLTAKAATLKIYLYRPFNTQTALIHCSADSPRPLE